jgi:hypothetical protein
MSDFSRTPYELDALNQRIRDAEERRFRLLICGFAAAGILCLIAAMIGGRGA